MASYSSSPYKQQQARTTFVMDHHHLASAADWIPLRVIHHFKWATAANFPMDELRARVTLKFAGQITHCETEFLCRLRNTDSSSVALQHLRQPDGDDAVEETDAAAASSSSESEDSSSAEQSDDRPCAAETARLGRSSPEAEEILGGIVWSAKRPDNVAKEADGAAIAAQVPLLMKPSVSGRAPAKGGVRTVTVRLERETGVIQVLKTARPADEWSSIELPMSLEDRETCFRYQLDRVGCAFNSDVRRDIVMRSWFPCLRGVYGGPVDDSSYDDGGADDDFACRRAYHCSQLIALSLQGTALCLPDVDPHACLPTQLHRALQKLLRRLNARRPRRPPAAAVDLLEL